MEQALVVVSKIFLPQRREDFSQRAQREGLRFCFLPSAFCFLPSLAEKCI